MYIKKQQFFNSPTIKAAGEVINKTIIGTVTKLSGNTLSINSNSVTNNVSSNNSYDVTISNNTKIYNVLKNTNETLQEISKDLLVPDANVVVYLVADKKTKNLIAEKITLISSPETKNE